MISGATRVVGVIGDPVDHTASPAMHNAAFETLKMNAGDKLRPADQEAAELVLAEIKHGKWAGINITTPHQNKS